MWQIGTFNKEEMSMTKEKKLYKVMVGGFDGYFMVRYARLIGIDIATGYNLIEYISDEERIKNGLSNYSYDYDFMDYKCKEI